MSSISNLFDNSTIIRTAIQSYSSSFWCDNPILLLFPTQFLLRIEEMAHCLGRSAIHARSGSEFLHGRLLDFFQRSEVGAQALPPFGADADDMVEDGDEVALAAQFSMKRDGKTVRLVTNALDEIEGPDCGAAVQPALNSPP